MSVDQTLHVEGASALLWQLTEHLRLQENKILQRQAALDERAEQLAKQATQLSEEKQKMTAVGIADNDVLDLNVGGTLLSVKRSTLVQVEGSLLASMFSGRWEQSLDHDSNGRVFLDFEPYCFKQILTCLQCRQMQMGQEEKVAGPVINQGMQFSYACLVDYLGLEAALGSRLGTQDTKTSNGLKFALVSEHFLVHRVMMKGKWTETAETSTFPCSSKFGPLVMAGPNMRSGKVYYFKMQCKFFASFIGSAKDSHSYNMCPSATAFGWSHNCRQCAPITLCWSAGTATVVPVAPEFHLHFMLQADLITGQLACIDLAAVYQSTPVSYKMQVPIPSAAQQSYKFQVTTHDINELRLLPVSEADKQLFAKTS